MNSKNVFRALIAAILLPIALHAQSPEQIPVRIATYDLLSYTGDVESRNQDVRAIVAAIEPTILVVHRLSTGGDALFVAKSWNEAGIRQALPGGSASGSALYYNDLVVGLVSYRPATAPGDYDEWVMNVRSTSDTIHLFGASLDPGDDATSRGLRAQSALAIRSALIAVPANRYAVVLGPLNVYTSNEDAYQNLTQVGTFTPNVVDPIDLPGNWNNNSEFADIHTQSTRITAFGGGAGGGMDDRFDFILCSQSLIDAAYIPESYTAFGNDGLHFNDSINDLPNLAVSDSIANALYRVSDHLPVYADFSFERATGSVDDAAEADGIAVAAWTSAGGDELIFDISLASPARASIRLYDLLGREVAAIPAEHLRAGRSRLRLDVGSLPAGRYIYSLDAAGRRRGGVVGR